MLLDLLKKEQAEMDLSNREFAKKLGVPRSTWTGAQLGIRPLNNQIVRGAMKAFPHLVPEAVIFLVSDSTKGKDGATKEAEHVTAETSR